MESIQPLASTARVATAHDSVLNAECAYTFHSPYTSDQGIVVNLNTFMGTIQELAMTNDDDKALFLRIVKKRVPKEEKTGKDIDGDDGENKSAPIKLGIGVEGGFALEDDAYDTISTYSVVLLKKESDGPPSLAVELPYSDETKDSFPMQVSQSADSIIHHVGLGIQQEVKAWQLDQDDIPVSKYAATLPFVDNGVMIDPIPSSWKCEKSGETENLWLNLSDGYIGGGRKNWDGSGGSNGALDHYSETGEKYPLVVKLGTITGDLDTADCYSYAKDEDGPVKIPNLAELLQKRGINIAAMQKTVKSTAELEVELNANYAFDAITESGSQLMPVSGPGLQGLQNLGNSCYMNSVVQMLLSGTVPELAQRYGIHDNKKSVIHHEFFEGVTPKQAPSSVLCQTAKLSLALTSGDFAMPEAKDDADGAVSSTDPKYRLAPRMFKHVIGKDHVDFRTGQQQDAAQYLQHLLELMDRAELGAKNTLWKDGTPPLTSSHLFSFKTSSRRVCSADEKVKYSENAPETIWSIRVPMEKAVVIPVDQPATSSDTTEQEDTALAPDQKRHKAEEKKEEPIPTIAFQACLEEWAAEKTVNDYRWAHLQNAVHPTRELTRFANFPRYLLVQIQRYQLGPDWTPIKLKVCLDIPQQLDLNSYKATGPQPDETLVPEVEESPSTVAGPPPIDEAALAQLMDMGFSINGCKRALTAVGGSDVEAATNWVFEHNMDPDFNDPLPEQGTDSATRTSASNDSGVDEGVVMSLVDSLGCFTADQVRAALKETNGAADRAADWLFSHMDDLDGAIAALNSRSEQQQAGTANTVPLEDGDGTYTMVGIISHIGEHTGGGHYVAHLKKQGDRWVIFNDEKVAFSESPPIPHAYMYLFQRSDTLGSHHPDY